MMMCAKRSGARFAASTPIMLLTECPTRITSRRSSASTISMMSVA
jgi:hypothetical protein